MEEGKFLDIMPPNTIRRTLRYPTTMLHILRFSTDATSCHLREHWDDTGQHTEGLHLA